jgi:predicted PurR-regulated permease PerM
VRYRRRVEPRDSLPMTGPGSRNRRRWFLGVSALLAVAVLIAARQVLLPFVLAIVLAYVLSPVVDFGQGLLFRGKHPSRWVVVLSLYVVLVSALAALVTFSAPRLAAELGRLSRETPRLLAVARQEWLPELDRRVREATKPYLPPRPAAAEGGQARPEATPNVALEVRPRPSGGFEVVLPNEGLRVVRESEHSFRVEPGAPRARAPAELSVAIRQAASRLTRNTEDTTVAILQTVQSFVLSLARGILGFVLTLVMSAYLLISSDRIFEFARSLYVTSKRAEFDDLVRRLDRGLSGVIRGQLIICAVNGVLSGIGFYSLGLKYWSFLTLIAAVGSIIPIFGSILSTIPAVLVGLEQGVGVALLTLGWILAIHQLEANVLNPKIMGDAARVHPVLVVFALIAGEHLAGLVGALLAVPVLSITQTLFLYLRERYLGVPRSSSFPPPVPKSPVAITDTSPSGADPSRAG